MSDMRVFVSGELSKNSQDEKVKINNQDPERGYLEEKLDPNQFEIDNNNHLVRIKSEFLTGIELTKSNIKDFNENDYVHTINDETISGNKTFNDIVTFLNDIIIKGSVTEVESTNLNIDDNLIELNKNETGNGVSLGIAGILINRGTLPAAKFIFDESDDKWKLIIEGVSESNIVEESWVSSNFLGINDQAADSDKLDGQDGSYYLDRQNHTGTQLASTISDFQTTVSDNSDVQASKAHLSNTDNPHQVSKTQIGLENVTNDAQLKRSADDFSSFSEKTILADNDKLLLEDSEDDGEKKYVLVKNLPSGGSSSSTTSSIPMTMVYGPLEVNENETNIYQITNFDNTFTYTLSFNDSLLSGTVNNDGTITVVSGDITDGNDHIVTMSIYSTKDGVDSLVNNRDITVKPLSYIEDSTESFEGTNLNEDNIEESDGNLV